MQFITTGKLETMGISIDDMREAGWSDEEMVKQGWQMFRDVGPFQWEYMGGAYNFSAYNFGSAHEPELCDSPSRTTQTLIDALLSRDAAGRAKYGTSLDRTDLSFGDWCQHLIEELLDAAGYAQRMKETHGVQTVEVKLSMKEVLDQWPALKEVCAAAVDVVETVNEKGTLNYQGHKEALARLRAAVRLTP